VIKGCSEIFVPVLKFIENRKSITVKVSYSRKQAAVVPVKKATLPLPVTTDLSTFLIFVSKVFEFRCRAR
jgi:hypothetical protein